MGKRKNWTEEEIQYLEDKWGMLSTIAIASKLGRSIEGVKLKACRLGLGDQRLAIDGITMNQFSKATKIPYRTLKYWIEHKDFPARKKLLVKENRILIVKYDEFWKWAEKNKRLINFAKFEPNILGLEPEWVKIKRGADMLNVCKKDHNEPWSDKEDKELISMVKAQKFTYPDIARQLKRSELAIRKRLMDLNIKLRPLSFDNHVKWNDEQIKILLDLFNKGFGYNTIAERLGRSAHGVRGKLERMGYRFRKTV